MRENNRNILILGAGESGIGASILAIKKEWNVYVSDYSTLNDSTISTLNNLDLKWEHNGHTFQESMDFALVVKSPGIPDDVPVVHSLRNKGLSIISEIEFAGIYNTAKTICVTGSNGKTTTVKWIYSILKNAKFNVALAGNIGDSFARQVAEKKVDWFVLELSSFQLDGIVDFCPDIAILLNITPDHLDRYNNSFESYIESKFKILKNQESHNWFIYNADDNRIRSHLDNRKMKMKTASFHFKKKS